MTAKTLPAAALLAALLVAACKPAADTGAQAAPTPAAAATAPAATAAPSYAGWVGKWTGPEGLFVTIADAGEGRYDLEMQSDLDTRGSYTGTATAEGIAFERGGEIRVLRKATGAETGLKWLADKQDCLMVVEGEGYCRD